MSRMQPSPSISPCLLLTCCLAPCFLVWCPASSLMKFAGEKAGPSTAFGAQPPRGQRPPAGGPGHAPNFAQDDSTICPKENPRLCRGGSSSLTFPGVLRGFAMDAKEKLRRPYGTPRRGLAANPALKCWANTHRASGARVLCEHEERGSIEWCGEQGKRIRPF